MLGLSLEGGGAKGAFHMGAIKAFLEAGYEFRGITGTSIGALNGAVVAQGDFEAGYQWWNSVDNASLFDLEQPQMQKLLAKKVDKESLVYFSSKLKDIIENKGLDTGKMRRMLHRMIDEEKLRNSPVDFGIVTVSLSDFKPLELYKEDIPEGKMLDYLMASANFPAFKLEPIEGKYYIDGGFYDNCPVNLLSRKGYEQVIVIRTMSIGIKRKPENPHMQVTYLIPSDSLGRTLNFDQKSIQRDLKLGYYDAQKLLKHLLGKYYYISPVPDMDIMQSLISMPDEQIRKIGTILQLPEMEPKRLLFEKVFPELARHLSIPSTSSYQEIIIRLLELLAENKKIERFQIRDFTEFLTEIKSKKTSTSVTRKPLLMNITENIQLAPIFSKDILLQRVAQEFLKVL